MVWSGTRCCVPSYVKQVEVEPAHFHPHEVALRETGFHVMSRMSACRNAKLCCQILYELNFPEVRAVVTRLP